MACSEPTDVRSGSSTGYETSTDGRIGGRKPLTALLSYALVAFIIEFDNEFERRMPHRTTDHGATASAGVRPWLVSFVMWANCLRFVDDSGITVGALEQRAGTTTNLAGMERWGYITIERPAVRGRQAARSAWMIRPKRAGRIARELGRPLLAGIEKRWRGRFGEAQIDELREALWAVVSGIAMRLPDCLPILGYGLVSRLPNVGRTAADCGDQSPAEHGDRTPAEREDGGTAADREDGPLPPPPEQGNALSRELSLAALLARLLLAFTLEFERESAVSLPIGANVLRVLGADGIPIRELPRRAGVSKPAIAMALSFLEERDYVTIEPLPDSRGKMVSLTATGRHARGDYLRLLAVIEERWQARFKGPLLTRLRNALEAVVGASGPTPALLQGLRPDPTGWRASVPAPQCLPDYPMVLHRGGFPDGS